MQRDEAEEIRRRFGAFVRAAALRAGYDLSPGKGGQAQIARYTGMAPSSVSRMFQGLALPDPRFFEPLAKVLHVSVRELLVESGIISPETLTESRSAQVRSRSITPEEAADELGITDPIDRELFLGAVDRLRRRARERESGDQGGSVAER